MTFAATSITSFRGDDHRERSGIIGISNRPWIPLIYCSGLPWLKLLVQAIATLGASSLLVLLLLEMDGGGAGGTVGVIERGIK